MTYSRASPWMSMTWVVFPDSRPLADTSKTNRYWLPLCNQDTGKVRTGSLMSKVPEMLSWKQFVSMLDKLVLHVQLYLL